MTEANKDNCKREGAKVDLRMEDLEVAWVAAETAGEVAIEVLETAPRADCLTFILLYLAM